MTPARKLRIWTARDGRCGRCAEPLPVDGPKVEYDHFIPLWISQDDFDTGIWPLHTKTCHAPKTAVDKGVIAKIKRIIKKRDPATRPKPRRPIRSNPKIPSRPFAKVKRPFRRKPK